MKRIHINRHYRSNIRIVYTNGDFEVIDMADGTFNLSNKEIQVIQPQVCEDYYTKEPLFEGDRVQVCNWGAAKGIPIGTGVIIRDRDDNGFSVEGVLEDLDKYDLWTNAPIIKLTDMKEKTSKSF